MYILKYCICYSSTVHQDYFVMGFTLILTFQGGGDGNIFSKFSLNFILG